MQVYQRRQSRFVLPCSHRAFPPRMTIDLIPSDYFDNMATSYTFQDLSGSTKSTTGNPYDGLIEACHNDPVCLYHNISDFVSHHD